MVDELSNFFEKLSVKGRNVENDNVDTDVDPSNALKRRKNNNNNDDDNAEEPKPKKIKEDEMSFDEMSTYCAMF